MEPYRRCRAFPPIPSRSWRRIYYFGTMAENVRAYFAHLASARVEERMRMEAFLTYKDTFTKYLREFVLGLQDVAGRIVSLLKESNEALERQLFERVAVRKLLIHAMDEGATLEDFQRSCAEDWHTMRVWFCGQGGRRSDLAQLEERTKATIERIAGFAERLASQHQQRVLDSLVVDGEIAFAKLPPLTREVRQELLTWLTRCMGEAGACACLAGTSCVCKINGRQIGPESSTTGTTTRRSSSSPGAASCCGAAMAPARA